MTPGYFFSWILPSYLSILTESCFQISCSCHRRQIANPQALASFFFVLCWWRALAWCFGCFAVCSFRVFAFSFTCFALCFLIGGTDKKENQETMEMWSAIVFTCKKALYCQKNCLISYPPHTRLSIRPGTYQSSSRHSVVNHSTLLRGDVLLFLYCSLKGATQGHSSNSNLIESPEHTEVLTREKLTWNHRVFFAQGGFCCLGHNKSSTFSHSDLRSALPLRWTRCLWFCSSSIFGLVFSFGFLSRFRIIFWSMWLTVLWRSFT